jgi:hypothetical protein
MGTVDETSRVLDGTHCAPGDEPATGEAALAIVADDESAASPMTQVEMAVSRDVWRRMQRLRRRGESDDALITRLLADIGR